ncbi:hypothetical protein P9112_002468 [Eukaryota sp. TZLM1-RC]
MPHNGNTSNFKLFTTTQQHPILRSNHPNQSNHQPSNISHHVYYPSPTCPPNSAALIPDFIAQRVNAVRQRSQRNSASPPTPPLERDDLSSSLSSDYVNDSALISHRDFTHNICYRHRSHENNIHFVTVQPPNSSMSLEIDTRVESPILYQDSILM